MLLKWGSFLKCSLAFKRVGCSEASFTIIRTIHHTLEHGSKSFSCFLDVRKAFDTVWIDGLLYELFLELGIKGRMWLDIRDLYTNVKAQDFTRAHCLGKHMLLLLLCLLMMLMKWLPTVIIMAQIVNIFCSPPHLLFCIILVPIKNHTVFYFFWVFCVRRIH